MHSVTNWIGLKKRVLYHTYISLMTYWAWRYMIWNIPLASLDPLSWLCPLPSRLLVPSRAWEAGKPLTSTSTAQQQPKHRCVISIVFILSPKHSTRPAAVKEINSIPAKTMTDCNLDKALPFRDLAFISDSGGGLLSDRGQPLCPTQSGSLY